MGGHTSGAWRSRPGSPRRRAPPRRDRPRGDGRTLSYAALLDDADAAARRLHARGARAGDRVGSRYRPARRSRSHSTGACAWAPSRSPSTCGSATRSAPHGPRAAPSRSTRRSTAPGRTRGSSRHTISTPCRRHPHIGTTGTGRAIELTYGNWLWSALGSAVALGLDPWESAGSAPCRSRTSAACRSSCAPRSTARRRSSTGLRRRRRPRTSWAARRSSRSSRPSSPGCSTPACASRRGCAPCCSAADRSRRCLLERSAGAGGVRSRLDLRPHGGVLAVTTGGFPLFCTRVALSPAGEILVGGPTVAPGSRGDDGSCTAAISAASTRMAACGSPAARRTRS
jgi:O-succinylbenzoic acid--CoA ligase